MAQLGRVWADGIWNTAIWNTAIWAPPSEPVEVPDVVGLSQAAAESSLEGAGFTVRVLRSYSDTIPAGEVISQSPTAGNEIPEGSEVTITVSRGVFVPGEADFIEPISFIGFIE